MPRLEWSRNGEKLFETGVDRGVLYPQAGPGVAWVGLIAVNENVSGGDVESHYYDGVKYLDVVASEDFEATIEAFSAPREFAACDGTKQLSPGLFATQQPRKPFGFSYRTLIGNDLEGVEFGYKLHLVYNCMASPAARSSQTLAGVPNLSTRSWTVNTVPPEASTFKPTAHFVIDSTLVDPFMLANLESYLYGRDGLDPILPSQAEVLTILANVITEPISEPI